MTGQSGGHFGQDFPNRKAGCGQGIYRGGFADLKRVMVRVAIDRAMNIPTPIAMPLTGTLRNTAAE